MDDKAEDIKIGILNLASMKDLESIKSATIAKKKDKRIKKFTCFDPNIIS